MAFLWVYYFHILARTQIKQIEVNVLTYLLDLLYLGTIVPGGRLCRFLNHLQRRMVNQNPFLFSQKCVNLFCREVYLPELSYQPRHKIGNGCIPMRCALQLLHMEAPITQNENPLLNYLMVKKQGSWSTDSAMVWRNVLIFVWLDLVCNLTWI